jgi:hypothetical protein
MAADHIPIGYEAFSDWMDSGPAAYGRRRELINSDREHQYTVQEDRRVGGATRYRIIRRPR